LEQARGYVKAREKSTSLFYGLRDVFEDSYGKLLSEVGEAESRFEGSVYDTNW
jgi:hypothetical protein